MKASGKSISGLNLSLGILITGTVFVVFLTAICIWRKKRFKQKVRRMRQLSSTFFRRKRQRLREAKQPKSKSPESRQNCVQNQSNGSLIPLDGLGDDARKEKVKQKIDCVNNRERDNPSFILTESKTDPAYLTMERIIPQDGMKSQANKDNCFKTDIVQVHVNNKELPEFRASDAESKYLTLDGPLPDEIVKMDQNCQNGDNASESNKNNVVSITFDSMLEDRRADLGCDTARKKSSCTNSDEKTEEIFMHESTSDMGGTQVTVDIESDLESTKGQTKNSCNQFDEIRDLAIEARERDSDEADNCLQSLQVENETDECSAHAGANGERSESDQLQGHQCKQSQWDTIRGQSAVARHNIKKRSKSKGEDGNGKQCSGLPSQVSTQEVKGNSDEEATGTDKSDILNTQQYSKEAIEQSDENCSTTMEVSTIRLHRQAFSRKHNSKPALSGSHKDDALSSQTEYRTKSERHDITSKNTKNSINDRLQELQCAEKKGNSFKNRDTFVDDIEKSTRNQRPETVSSGKNKYRKKAVRRKSPLELKTSDESGYASSASDRDRHVSETSNISVEIIAEEECS